MINTAALSSVASPPSSVSSRYNDSDNEVPKTIVLLPLKYKCTLEQIPEHMRAILKCPITHEVFQDPVIASDGHTYDQAHITYWLIKRNNSPLNGE